MKDYNTVDWESIVYYDETSPTFLRWNYDNPRYGIVKGSVAGYILAHGYAEFNYKCIAYRSHRVIWVLHNGSIDDNLFIDHIDGNKSNNTISNLRLVDIKLNARNSASVRSNTGVKGVSYQQRDDAYIAHWRDTYGKVINKYFYCGTLGADVAFKMACDARVAALNEINGQGAGYTERHANKSKYKE